MPADASIIFNFTHAINEASLVAGLIVVEDGVTRPFTLAGENDGKTWRFTPLSPWSAGAWIGATLVGNIYTPDGVLLYLLPVAEAGTLFRIQPAAGAPTVTGLFATGEFVDVRLSSPAAVWLPGAGLRRAGRTIGARAEQLGPTWWRLVADEPLTNTDKFFDGLGQEFPLLLRSAPSRTPIEGKAGKSASGEYLVRFSAPLHPFELNAGTALLDVAGNPLPHELLLSDDGRTAIMRPLGSAPPARLRLGDTLINLP